MKFPTRMGLAAASALLSFQALAMDPSLDTEEAKVGYMIGMDIGQSLIHEGTRVDLEALIEALRATYAGGATKMTAEEARKVRENFIAARRAKAQADAEALVEKNGKAGEAFLASNQSKPGVVVTDSGLQYKVVEMGSGPRPSATDTVKVHYRGTFLDGQQFDSSYDRGAPAEFPLNGVIAGWTEGVQLMPVGSKFEFYIKPELAYGRNGNQGIPPNSPLVFEVELLEIK